MDMVLSAVAADLVGRLLSFLIRKSQEPGATDHAVRLERALLRARAVVEEAEGRQITNRAMLQQLNQLRRELCRGSYVLDDFRRRAVDAGSRPHATASRRRSGHVLGDDGLAAVESLEAALGDMKEFVVLLAGYPRVNRQPYSAYLFMESCMFGRQLEKEEIVAFLLRPSQDLDVLPVIGPRCTGKHTLVEHVCRDDRMRGRFTEIHRLNADDLGLQSHEDHRSLVDGNATSLVVVNATSLVNGNATSLFDGNARSLVIVDLTDGDPAAASAWTRFCSAMRRRAPTGCKIIVISRTEAHSSLGTAPPLRLRAPSREELWYFFRSLAFGGANPDDRPELLRIAMALFRHVCHGGWFAHANVFAASLRADMSVRSWRRVLKVLAAGTMLQLGHPGGGDRFSQETLGYYSFFRPVNSASSVPYLIFNNRKVTPGTEQSELPKVTMPELLTGVPVPEGETRFDVLVWRSRIPPYVSYVATCDLVRARQLELPGGEKRVAKRRQQQDARSLPRTAPRPSDFPPPCLCQTSAAMPSEISEPGIPCRPSIDEQMM